MTPYSKQPHDPPTPVGTFSLQTLANPILTIDNVMGLLDTGAETTLLPRWAIEQLGLIPTANTGVALEWFDGSKTSAESVEVRVIFQGGRFRGEYGVIDQPTGVIGRNLLNYFRLLFDGPARVWQRM